MYIYGILIHAIITGIMLAKFSYIIIAYVLLFESWILHIQIIFCRQG